MAHVASTDGKTSPLLPADSEASRSSDGTERIEHHIKDSLGQQIWTCDQFEWAIGDLSKAIGSFDDNDYVSEMWSTKFFVACKKDMSLAKESLKNFGRCMMKGHPYDASQHLLNALAVALQGAINIEVANLLKGVVGVLVSTVKFTYHTVVAVGSLLLSILTIISAPIKGRKMAEEYFETFLNNFGLVGKDLTTALTCLGHAIPAWLPGILLTVCPPAGAALAIVKVLSKFTGISDLVGYGGTGLLLLTKAHKADATTEEGKKTIDAWNEFKEELDPRKTSEGAMLSFYAVHITCEAITTGVDAVLPGVGTAAKYGAYGIQALAAGGLAFNLCRQNGAPKEHTA